MLYQQVIAFVVMFCALIKAQNIVIHNWCPFDVHTWEVRSGENVALSRTGTVASGTIGRQPATLRWLEGNPVVKIAQTPYLDDPTNGGRPVPILQIEYGYRADRVSYDLSYIDCEVNGACPFAHHQHRLESASARNCPAAGCKSSEAKCRGSYQKQDDHHAMLTCLDPTADTVAYLCMEHAPRGTFSEFLDEDLDKNGVSQRMRGPEASGCAKRHVAVEGEICLGVAAKYGISWPTFHRWNPSVGEDCKWLIAGKAYCVAKRGRH